LLRIFGQSESATFKNKQIKKTMKSRIIAISGKIGSGKDEVAKLIAEKSKIQVERRSFADKIKEITESLTGIKMKIFHEKGNPFYNAVYNYTQEDKNIYLKNWNKTIGQILQQLGTDVFRNNFNKDIWINSLFDTTGKECLENGRILVIPDCRFPNEANAVLDKGGIVIRMVGDPMNIRSNSTRDLIHESEIALDEYDKFTETIHNDVPDIEVLRKKIFEVLEKHQIF